jgi:NAD(P) transhydrogenase
VSESPAYDLIVIGSGPAGEKGAAQAAYFGKRVVLIEREEALGGAAANTGTLPSKTLRETSLMLSGLKARDLYGVDLSLRRQATVQDFLHRERRIVDGERRRISGNLDRHRVTLLHGEASFVDAHRVQVDRAGREPVVVRGEVILVATGSRPHRPEIFPLDDSRVYDSDSILDLGRLPETLGVVGGGVIGCEYACTFAALGVEVHLVEGRDVLLGFLDGEISRALRSRMEALGVRFHMPDAVGSCEARPEAIVLSLESGGTLSLGAVLVAAGRSGNTASLNLAAAGLPAGKRGLLEVDDHFRTAVPSIYAAGDVIGFPALASTSMEQARLAMVHAFDLKYKTDLAPILPYGIYTIPEVSMAGETEESLRKAKVDYVAGRAGYDANARGQIIGDSEGFLKLLFRRDDGRLLGVHVIGEIASEIVHVGLTALLAGAGRDLFIRTCYNYPTLGELYKYATYDAMGKMAGETTG